MAQKLNLVELAIRGINNEVLAKNIASMNPSMIIASRILNGIEIPTLEQAQTYIQKRRANAIVTKVQLGDAFAESCLQIEYKYPRIVYWRSEYNQPENIDCVDYEEYRKMDRISGCRETPTDEYKYKMTYWSSTWDNYIPENVCE